MTSSDGVPGASPIPSRAESFCTVSGVLWRGRFTLVRKDLVSCPRLIRGPSQANKRHSQSEEVRRLPFPGSPMVLPFTFLRVAPLPVKGLEE